MELIYKLFGRLKEKIRIRGHVDHVDEAAITGWVADEAAPERRLLVELMDGSVVVAGALAIEYREDVEQASVGDGRYGFTLRIPESLKDGATHHVSVIAQGIQLGEAISYCKEPPRIRGRVDRLGEAAIIGWVADEAAPERRLLVELMDGSVVVAGALAIEYREDVEQASVGDGRYGFTLRIPESLKDGATHHISVITQDPAGIQLGEMISYYSHKARSDIAGFVHAVTDAVVRGWAWDAENPQRKISLVVSIDGQPIRRVQANEYSPNLPEVAGDGRIGFRMAIPREFLNGNVHVITVTLADDDRIELEGSPRHFSRQQLRFLGQMDSINKGIVSGWAFNPAQLDQRVVVSIELDGVPITLAIADDFRKDLIENGIGDGYHGFSVKLPGVHLRLGKEHVVTAKFVQSDLPFGTKSLVISKNDLDSLRSSQRLQTPINWGARPQHTMLTEYPHEPVAEFISELVTNAPGRQRKAAKKLPLVSVIMPSFNRAGRIHTAIESVQKQDYQNWKLHVVDDGSDDGTEEVVKRYLADPRIAFHRMDHKGVSAARNTGLAHARGEFIAYLDTDNAWSSCFLSVMVRSIQDKKLDAAYSAIRAWGEQQTRYRYAQFDFEALKIGNFIDLNAFVHHRKLYDARGGFDESLRRLVDWDFILNLVKNANVQLIPFIGVEYDDRPAPDRITNNESLVYQFVVINKHAIDWDEAAARPRVNGMLSVIIVNLNKLQLTQSCLLSIMENTGDVPYEIVLVDNGSRNDVKVALEEFCAKFPCIRMISNARNLNFALGYNVGAAHAVGEFVIALNNDTMVTPNWADPLLDRLRSDPGIGVVQPKLLYPDGTVQCAGAVFSSFSPVPYHVYSGYPGNDPAVNRPRHLNALTGAAFVVRALDFYKLRGFDPIYVNGGEDTDYCLRMKEQLGLRCFYEPASTVYHLEGKTEGRDRNIQYNRDILFKRWSQKYRGDDLKLLDEDGFVPTSYTPDVPVGKDGNIPVFEPVLMRKDYLHQPGRRVLIVKPSGVGNLVMSTPALSALRELLPNAHLTMLCFRAEASIAAPLVDEVLIIGKDTKTGAVDSSEIDQLIAMRRFDIAIYPPFTNLGKPTPLMERKIAHHVVHPSVDYVTRHESEHALDLARMLGWEGPVPLPAVPVSRPSAMLPPTKSYVGVHIGASGSAHMQRKRWPIDKWKMVVEEIASEWQVVFFGGAEERPEIESLISSLPDQARARCAVFPDAPLEEVAHAIKEAAAFLSNDSGLMHVAAAVGTPVVAVFGPTAPSKNAPVINGGSVEIVRAGVPCSPCYISHAANLMKCQDQICLSEISPEMVLSAFQRVVVARGPARKPALVET